MRRNKNLFKHLKGNGFLVFVVVLLTIFHRLTFSYIPMFSNILINKLELFLNVVDVEGKTNLPSFILNFINQYEDIVSIILSIILMLLAWQLVRYIMLYFETRLKGVLSENVSRNLRTKTYDHIQNLSYGYHNNVDSGDLIQRVTTDIDLTKEFVSNRVMELLGILSSLVFGAYQMALINQTIMYVSLALIPVTGISSIIYFSKIDKVFKDVETKEAEMVVVIQENVSAARVVRAFANEKHEVEKLEAKNIAYQNSEIRAGKLVAGYWSIMDFFMMLQFLIVILIGVYYANKNMFSISDISSTIMLAGMLIWPVRGLGRIINEYGKALVASERLEEIMKQETEYVNDGTLMPEINGNIVFSNVSFKFIDESRHLLNNVSFEIKAGETVAIIGKTGSGKSTIINLLLKMYDYEGSITINGVELRDINKRYLRRNIGTVLQDPFLYSKTVYQNISIANKKANEADILKAAKIASLEKDINTFKQGYDTVVGEQGSTLSGGQKQRVAIARILVSRLPIIIFDDALSALDNKTDLDIRNQLKASNENQTNIIITHRMTTAKEADKIIVLNNNEIEAIGTHDELKNKEGLYKNLWDIQGALEEEFLELVRSEINGK
ncbi:ABC transporter ATP-binding protein [Haploplasma modicum]|uniref:ABC transporter ATP-binding protein n=1 Tax=Haploplasma modicum TaxID=2150 RepID=UPI00214B0FCC|nr:ABC transporter ATP-binding protein [Haploplasma modicum]MCR1809198.1 ABC transporter ATP-binding protein/permease [Haploplasma modicum]